MLQKLRVLVWQLSWVLANVGWGLPGAGDAVAADRASIDQAVAKAAEYLRGELASTQGGRRTLVAYTLLKAGEPATSPLITPVVNEVLKKFTDTAYNGPREGGGESQYEAGLEAMFLGDVDPVKYRPQIEILASYLIGLQTDTGCWDYHVPPSGDTSVTQFAVMGLWAAARAGVEIPPQVWDKAMMWHFGVQGTDGGFAYTPKSGAGANESTANMTAAGIASMTIAAMHLFPRDMQRTKGFSGTASTSATADSPDQKYGVLLRREYREPGEAGPSPASLLPETPEDFNAKSTFAEYERRLRVAMGFFARNYVPEAKQTAHRSYFFYAFERLIALTDTQKHGDRDWFDESATFLVEHQRPDGSWDLISEGESAGRFPVNTSFCVLFLARTTAKLLNRLPRSEGLGGGILAGGRGLPDDLNAVETSGGNVEVRKPAGPLDELLRDLEKANLDGLFALQEQIIEKVQLGDRSELIGQSDRLLKLVHHPSADVRRTAIWALGRSDNLSLVRYAVEALKDPDVDVLVEAHNALCWYSRRPNAFGLADNPVEGLPPDASVADKTQALETWRKAALKNWGTWYLQVCPYQDRDDPFAVELRETLAGR
jgi:prenyltransferase beta subunit